MLQCLLRLAHQLRHALQALIRITRGMLLWKSNWISSWRIWSRRRKRKILDSGANISIVSSLSHLDSNTFPTFLRADKPFVVQIANNSTMENQGRGQFE